MTLTTIASTVGDIVVHSTYFIVVLVCQLDSLCPYTHWLYFLIIRLTHKPANINRLNDK